jgi:CheY-like chemotaxis protein
MRFSVTDTGIGISEDFLPKVFEPFEQEHTGATSIYGGTGLGMAISKNIVEMMGGRISVSSIKGIGTEFVVEVPLGLGEESRKKRAVSAGYALRRLNILVVDDEVLVCEQTRAILQDMGMYAEWVDSGAKAVRIVQDKWDVKKYYDIILIDWKMPGMDGIETTRRIRRIVGPDVTIIIMTAYDWQAIEVEAKKAGVNLLISKPLFRTSLASTFEEIYAERGERMRLEAPVEYDFTGKRVLLVEDHLLNVEVAKRLLSVKGAEVETAENGLSAIEAFVQKPAYYYDIILMDIRMPVMDGLTAAHSIRHMKKQDAKTVPIVAMSANAFDEDVEKSKDAGMNAHLAKPIEPDLLYATLREFLSERRNETV